MLRVQAAFATDGLVPVPRRSVPMVTGSGARTGAVAVKSVCVWACGCACGSGWSRGWTLCCYGGFSAAFLGSGVIALDIYDSLAPLRGRYLEILTWTRGLFFGEEIFYFRYRRY